MRLLYQIPSFIHARKSSNMVVVLLLQIGGKKVNMISISICYEMKSLFALFKWVCYAMLCCATCHIARRRNDLWPFTDIIIHYFYICLHLFWIVSNCKRIIIKCIHVIGNCYRRTRANIRTFSPANNFYLYVACI